VSNTATVTGTGIAGTGSHTVTGLSFPATPSAETNRYAVVSDPMFALADTPPGVSGLVTFDAAGAITPVVFQRTYTQAYLSSQIGGNGCGNTSVINTATLSNPTTLAQLGQASSTVHFRVVGCGGGGEEGGPGCTLTQGYWKTHGPAAKGNNGNMWPASAIPMTLGSVSYTAIQLQSIFNTPVEGNGLIALAHQLIAAKLNIANGANGTTINATIAAADALIGGLVVPPVGSGNLATSVTSALNDALAAFNQGQTGPGHCD
jgi:hypothetical protein